MQNFWISFGIDGRRFVSNTRAAVGNATEEVSDEKAGLGLNLGWTPAHCFDPEAYTPVACMTD